MGGKAIVAAVVLAIAGGTGYYLFVEKQKREQRRAVTALLGDTTTQLRAALAAPAAPEAIAKIDGNLKAAKAPRDRALADAAEHYIHGAREIVRRRVDAERLAREAAKSRRALSMHMAAAARRDTYWIRIATDLKKRVERDHHELDVSLKALHELLFTMPDTRKRLLEAQVDDSLVLAESERRKAMDQAQADAKRAADELEKVRRLALPK